MQAHYHFICTVNTWSESAILRGTFMQDSCGYRLSDIDSFHQKGIPVAVRALSALYRGRLHHFGVWLTDVRTYILWESCWTKLMVATLIICLNYCGQQGQLKHRSYRVTHQLHNLHGPCITIFPIPTSACILTE